MRNFRNLDVWKSSVQLVKVVYELTAFFPASEKFNLISQISRCAVSIPSNIAEGCARDSQKDFARFLQISLGSSFELETQFEIAKELNFIDNIKFEQLITQLHTIQKQIQSLKKYVETKI